MLSVNLNISSGFRSNPPILSASSFENIPLRFLSVSCVFVYQSERNDLSSSYSGSCTRTTAEAGVPVDTTAVGGMAQGL